MPRVALLIGVSEYGEGIPPLSAPPNDVAAMRRILEDPNLSRFDEVRTLIDPEPSDMRRAINRLFSNRGKEDLLLLFFSGHGITDDENRLYLANCRTNKADFDVDAVPASFIQDQSRRSYAKRQILILDCCYSGAFAEGWHTKSVGLDLARELGAEGRVVLTSSTATQPSFQQEEAELSLYTQYLVEGIKTGAADTDRDGKIHARELHEYAKAKVQEVKPKMQPGIIIDREGFNILLSQVRVNDPALEFRQFVERYAKHGEISRRGREILKAKQQEILVSDETAEEIINSVLEPFSRRRANLARYEEEFHQEAERQYPLEQRTEDELKDWQEFVLGLNDEDVAEIQQRILSELEQKQERQRNTLSQQSTPSPLQVFEFDVVTVDKQGQKVKRDRRQAQHLTEDLGNGVSLEMVAIPSGKFLMGAPETEAESYDYEKPQHSVSVKSFFIGKYPVSQAQWRAVATLPQVNCDLDPDPSHFKGENRPVEQVSWDDAVEFCARLSRLTQREYRLPSEAEWEYACRAGTNTPFHFGETITTDLANYCGTHWTYEDKLYKAVYGNGPQGVYREQTTEVGSSGVANAFGIYGMHGNVWEWCADLFHFSYEGAPTDGSAWQDKSNDDNEKQNRLVRGGSWLYLPWFCRSASRNYSASDGRYDIIGFRVVCA